MIDGQTVNLELEEAYLLVLIKFYVIGSIWY